MGEDCREAGFSAADVGKEWRFHSAKDFKEVGFSAADCKLAGFSAEDCREARFSAADIGKAWRFHSAKDFKKVGVSLTDCKEAGFSVSAMEDWLLAARRQRGKCCIVQRLFFFVFHRRGQMMSLTLNGSEKAKKHILDCRFLTDGRQSCEHSTFNVD